MKKHGIAGKCSSAHRTALAAVLGSAGMLIGLAAIPALAQDKKAAPAAEKAAPAAEKKADDGKPKTAWYKICAKVPIGGKPAAAAKDGKPAEEAKEPEKKNACTTFYESFNPATGAPLVYGAIEEGEGIKDKVLTVVVPTGLALPPGMAITVFQKDQWEKFLAQSKDGKSVKPEDIGLKPIELKYLHCHATGCASVSTAPEDFVAQMKTGVGLMVRAVELSNKVVDFPVPLEGFTKAVEGPAEDTQKFMQFRSQRLAQMKERRDQMLERLKKEKADLLKDAPKEPAPAGEKKKE